MMTDKKKKDADVLDALTHEAAMADAEEATKKPATAEEKREIQEMDSAAREMLQGLRKQAFEELRQSRGEPTRRSIPARILQMTREAIVERLHTLEATAPVELQAAYRKLDQLDLDELRVLLTDVEETLGEHGA